MIGSKNCLLLSLLLIILAVGGIMIGGSIAFTISCMLFIASGAAYHKSIMEAGLESFEQAIMSGEITEESAGNVPEFTIDLESLSESDREVIQRVFGFDLASGEDYTTIRQDDKQEDGTSSP